jgi:hypothetical protein
MRFAFRLAGAFREQPDIVAPRHTVVAVGDAVATADGIVNEIAGTIVRRRLGVAEGIIAATGRKKKETGGPKPNFIH